MVNHFTLMYIVQCTCTVHTSIGEGPRYYSVFGLFPSLYPPLGPPAAVRGCSGGGQSSTDHLRIVITPPSLHCSFLHSSSFPVYCISIIQSLFSICEVVFVLFLFLLFLSATFFCCSAVFIYSFSFFP